MLRRGSSLGIGIVVAALAVSAGSTAHAAPGSSQQTPTAVVRSVTPTSAVVAAGSRLNASVKGSGAIAFLLSLDRAPGDGDVSLGRHQVKGSKALRLRVPRKTQLGAYYLLGCAPVTKPAKRPRCRSAKTRMAVTGAPRPARVRPTPDAARAVSARLGRDGGTVTAAGADGTTYTLTIPAGALMDPATITITPQARIAKMPMKAKPAAGVTIEPAGRDLLTPGTLTIATPKPLPRTRLTAFGFQAGGGELHLTPVTRAGQVATLKAVELKGFGLALATAAARYKFSRSRLPTSLADQLQQVAAVPRAPRSRRATSSAAGPRDALSAQVFALYLATQADAISGDLDTAVIQYVAWDAFASPLAAAYPEVHSWRAALASAFSAALQRQIAASQIACGVNGDIAQMGRLLRYRDYLFTSLAALALQSLRAEIDSALDRCLRFELEYEVSIQGANSYGEGVTAQVKSSVPVRMAVPGDASSFSGTAPLQVVNYETGPADCWTHTWSVAPVNPLAIRRMNVEIMRERGLETFPPTIRVNFNLGSLDEQVTHICDGDPESAYTDQQHAYDGVAAMLLGGEAGSDFELTWFGGGSGGDYSTQTFTRSAEIEGSYTGTFTFRLRHDPA